MVLLKSGWQGSAVARQPPEKTRPWVSSPRPPSYDLPQRSRAAGDSTSTKPNEKQSPRANGIGSVPTTHIPARLEGPLGAGGGGRRGRLNEAKLFSVFKCQSSARCRWLDLAQLLCRGDAVWRRSARLGSRHGAPARSQPRRQVTCIFHSLGFITSWNADLARRAARGFRFPPCLFSLPCVLLPGEERSQGWSGEAGMCGCGLAGWMGIGLP